MEMIFDDMAGKSVPGLERLSIDELGLGGSLVLDELYRIFLLAGDEVEDAGILGRDEVLEPSFNCLHSFVDHLEEGTLVVRSSYYDWDSGKLEAVFSRGEDGRTEILILEDFGSGLEKCAGRLSEKCLHDTLERRKRILARGEEQASSLKEEMNFQEEANGRARKDIESLERYIREKEIIGGMMDDLDRSGKDGQ